MHVNEVDSQVMGQKLRQSTHQLKEKITISNASLSSFFWAAHYHIIRNVHLCHPYDSKQASFVSVELFGCQSGVCSADFTALLFHSFLLEFTYLFVQINSVGQAEPTV